MKLEFDMGFVKKELRYVGGLVIVAGLVNGFFQDADLYVAGGFVCLGAAILVINSARKKR